MDTSNLSSSDIKEHLISLLLAWQPTKWWQRILKRWLLNELNK